MTYSETLLDSHWAYKGKIIGLRLDTVRVQERTKVYELVDHPGAVVIVPIDAKGRLILVEQWRRAIGKLFVELPAGTLEAGEDPLLCAQRELREETGYAAKKLTPLRGFFSAPGFCNEYLHLFVGEELVSSPLAPDEDEFITLKPYALSDAIGAIEEGVIQDAKSIAGILRVALWKKKCGFESS